eukprot:gene49867-43100_t
MRVTMTPEGCEVGKEWYAGVVVAKGPESCWVQWAGDADGGPPPGVVSEETEERVSWWDSDGQPRTHTVPLLLKELREHAPARVAELRRERVRGRGALLRATAELCCARTADAVRERLAEQRDARDARTAVAQAHVRRRLDDKAAAATRTRLRPLRRRQELEARAHRDQMTKSRRGRRRRAGALKADRSPTDADCAEDVRRRPPAMRLVGLRGVQKQPEARRRAQRVILYWRNWAGDQLRAFLQDWLKVMRVPISVRVYLRAVSRVQQSWRDVLAMRRVRRVMV